MDSNMHSTASGRSPGGPGRPAPAPTGLAPLLAAVDDLAVQDLAALPDAEAAERVVVLRGLIERLEGRWLAELAAVDARGAAGAERGAAVGSTAAWLRAETRIGGAAAARHVLVARALHRGPLTRTARALAAGAISAAHAAVVAVGTHELPDQVAAEAEPLLVDAARRLDPPRLRRVLDHLRTVVDPDRADERARRLHERRGLWVSPTAEGMVGVDGLLDPEAGETLLAALEPLARPAAADDERSASRRRADALEELARRTLEAGTLPRAGGARPQVTVTVDLAGLLGGSGGPGGVAGWGWSPGADAVRRLACDATVTRVLVARRPASMPGGDRWGLAGRLRAALALLPPALGGAPSQPLDLGRAVRVVSGAQRAALAIRDGGCAVAGCDRPAGWCEAHHLRHWVHGGATDLANLVLVCRAHHRAVHDGGWTLHRGPSGHLTLTPPDRRPTAARAARRQPTIREIPRRRTEPSR